MKSLEKCDDLLNIFLTILKRQTKIGFKPNIVVNSKIKNDILVLVIIMLMCCSQFYLNEMKLFSLIKLIKCWVQKNI